MAMQKRQVDSPPVDVGAIGYGTMNLTWKPTQTPDEQAFKTLKTAIDGGCTFLNSGEFYGTGNPSLNLELLSRFFKAEPSYSSKVFLSVKGGIDIEKWVPDSSDEGLRKSVENINKKLDGRKMDLFEPSRVDKRRPIEDTMKCLVKLRDEGHFTHIGLSECSADTIRRAQKIAPIAAVELEYSLWSLDIERNGILDACEELKIPIIAYSPLGGGFLSGTVRRFEDIPEGDHRRTFDKWQPGNLESNLQLVDNLKTIATRLNISTTQLALSWLLAQSELIIPIPGSTRSEGVEEAIAAAHINLSQADLEEIRKTAESVEIFGGRHNAQSATMLDG